MDTNDLQVIVYRQFLCKKSNILYPDIADTGSIYKEQQNINMIPHRFFFTNNSYF